MAKLSGKILIVDDEYAICELLAHLVSREGLSPLVALDGNAALKLIAFEAPDVLIVDLRLPDMSGLEVMQGAKELDNDLPVILITAHAEVRGAVEAIKFGAHDYLAKPFKHEEVMRVILRAINERRLKQDLKNTSNQVRQIELQDVMGESDSIKRLAVDVSRVARSTFTVLIQGETGTGKEAIAHALHQASSRSKGPFVPVDCGAIPETLIESHLFGYEKGAFTGAQSQTHGTFEAASGGTLFLDEISNLSLSSQSKLLRVLQERAIYRVGGTKSIPVDARLVAASNHDLQTMVESGSFRSDLFFRLNEFAIRVPALRERKEDVLFLAKRFCDITSIELKKTPPQFSQSAIAALLAYDWPGNVRQLRSSIRRAVLLADGVITHDNLDIKTMLVSAFAPRLHEVSWDDSSLKEIVRRSTITVEREILNQVLRKTGGNKARAARLLQVDYKTIHSKVKEYGIAIDGGGYNGREEKGHVARN